MKSDPFQAFIATVNDLGRLPRGFDPKGKRPETIFKAIFKAAKPAVEEIWEIYTQRRDELSRKLITNKQSVVAYLFGFHLANMARAAELYHRADQRHQWRKSLKGKKVRIYDIGCGTGAMSLSLGVSGDYFLIDGSGPLLDTAKALAEASGLNVKTSRRVIEDLESKQFSSLPGEDTVHIYLLGYVWNELTRNNPARRKLTTLLKNHMTRNESSLIFIAEPALEQLSRPTMELRDTLCGIGYQALYPCPHSEHCPMLDRPKDWCYSEGDWNQPDLARWIDHELGMNRSRYAGTLFAFASPALGLTSDSNPVVVGRPVRDEGKERYKGFFDYLVCGPEGITKAVPKSPKNVIQRGTIFKEKPASTASKK
jgi:SAM-dependent methyltransferase